MWRELLLDITISDDEQRPLDLLEESDGESFAVFHSHLLLANLCKNFTDQLQRLAD